MTNSSDQAAHDYEEWNKFAAKLWAVIKEPPLAGSQISAAATGRATRTL